MREKKIRRRRQAKSKTIEPNVVDEENDRRNRNERYDKNIKSIFQVFGSSCSQSFMFCVCGRSVDGCKAARDRQTHRHTLDVAPLNVIYLAAVRVHQSAKHARTQRMQLQFVF